jgi:hypothetical protein
MQTTMTFRRRGTVQAAGNRSSARRRRSRALYCSTNGCTSFLVQDETTAVARCPICGYERRLA